MARYFLHYGAHTFELVDAKTAVEVRGHVARAGEKNLGGYRTFATADGGAVTIFFNPNVGIAVSATGDETEEGPKLGG